MRRERVEGGRRARQGDAEGGKGGKGRGRVEGRRRARQVNRVGGSWWEGRGEGGKCRTMIYMIYSISVNEGVYR